MAPLYALLLVAGSAGAWAWWRSRSAHDPASSVDSFNRALQAMQPVTGVSSSAAAPAPIGSEDDTSVEAVRS